MQGSRPVDHAWTYHYGHTPIYEFPSQRLEGSSKVWAAVTMLSITTRSLIPHSGPIIGQLTLQALPGVSFEQLWRTRWQAPWGGICWSKWGTGTLPGCWRSSLPSFPAKMRWRLSKRKLWCVKASNGMAERVVTLRISSFTIAFLPWRTNSTPYTIGVGYRIAAKEVNHLVLFEVSDSCVLCSCVCTILFIYFYFILIWEIM